MEVSLSHSMPKSWHIGYGETIPREMRPPSHPKRVLELLRQKTLDTRIAVVGASNAPDKYGNIIVKNLRRKGYAVIPVNTREQNIDGLPAVASLAEIDPPPTLVNIVTPPNVTRDILEQASKLPIRAVWLQDGSFDDEILDQLSRYSFETVYDACIMVVSNSV